MTAYRALALQTRCRSINGAQSTADARALMAATLQRIGAQVAASIAFIGRDCRLVVLPEYVLTGHPLGEPLPVWRERAAIDPAGAEEDGLARIAADNSIFLAANAYVTDPKFPALYFQACIVFGPTGNEVLRYRRLNSMFAPTPHDVLDQFLDTYGADALFPVARTDIGALAAIASEEILFPELARTFAIRGAEVFLHSTSEVSSPQLTPKAVARRARAIENVACVVSANTAGIEGSPIPEGSTDGGSELLDYEGRVLAQAGAGESMVANAEIDLAALRRARSRPGMSNLLARNRFDLYAQTYATTVHEPNGLAGDGAPERSYFMDAHRAAIARLQELGIVP